MLIMLTEPSPCSQYRDAAGLHGARSLTSSAPAAVNDAPSKRTTNRLLTIVSGPRVWIDRDPPMQAPRQGPLHRANMSLMRSAAPSRKVPCPWRMRLGDQRASELSPRHVVDFCSERPSPPRRMTWKSSPPADRTARHLLSSAPFPELPPKA